MTDIFKDFIDSGEEEDSVEVDLEPEEEEEDREEYEGGDAEDCGSYGVIPDSCEDPFATESQEKAKKKATEVRYNKAGKRIRVDGMVAKKRGPKPKKKLGRPPKVVDKRTVIQKKVLTGHELNKIIGMVLTGKTQKEMAKEFGVAVTTMFKYLHSSPKVEDAVAAARRESALHILERATEIALDDSKNFYRDGNGNLVPNAVNVQHRKLAVSQLNRVAGLYDPNKFSEKQAGIDINIGTAGKDQNGNTFGFVIYGAPDDDKASNAGAVEIMCDLSGKFKVGDLVVQAPKQEDDIIDIIPENT